MLVILKLKRMARKYTVGDDAKRSNFWKDIKLVQISSHVPAGQVMHIHQSIVAILSSSFQLILWKVVKTPSEAT